MGERKAYLPVRITIQCACWRSWRGHTEPELMRLWKVLRQGSSELALLWEILMHHTMAPHAAGWAEEKGIRIPRS